MGPNEFPSPCSRNAQDSETLALPDSDTGRGSDGGVEKNVEASLEHLAQESRVLEHHGGLTDSESKSVECDDLLEAEKTRLLAELELGAIFGGKTLLKNTTDPDANKIDLSQGFCEQASHSLHLQAGMVIESVPSNQVGNCYMKETGAQEDYSSIERNSKQDCGRKEKRSRRRGKSVNDDPEKTKWNTDIAGVTKYPKKEGEPRRVYSRKELEVLRYVMVADQKKLSKDVYKALSAEVRQKYDGLASSKRCCGNVNLKFDPKACLPVGGPYAARGTRVHLSILIY